MTTSLYNSHTLRNDFLKKWFKLKLGIQSSSLGKAGMQNDFTKFYANQSCHFFIIFTEEHNTHFSTISCSYLPSLK